MKKIVSILLVVVWMAFIFIMSSFNSVKSNNQSFLVVDILSNIFNINNIQTISYLIRKSAHFIEFFILGLFVSNATKRFNKSQILAIIICILYAISDEIHQLFVSGRSCKVFDIFIDSIGSISGILLLYNFNKIRRKK